MTDDSLEHPYCSGRFGAGAAEPLRPGGRELTRHAVHCAGFAAGQHILDLGCGSGEGTRLLRRRGCSAIGLDASTAALADAAAHLGGTPLVAARADRLPFADASLDGILAECTLSLVGGRDAALAECRRVLRPGARLAVTDVFARRTGTPDSPLPACLAGMGPRDEIMADLARSGFGVERWEDHSAVLKTFMARLIFASDTPDALWAGDPATLNAALRQRRPGYFLLVAAKAAGRT